MRRGGDQVGLDRLNFFIAAIQTAFGAFIAVYLTSERWTQTEIGIALSVGTLVGMAAQVPAGALVDAMADKRLALGLSIVGLIASTLIFAIWPTTLPVLIAQVVHALASCVLSPAIAAISLSMSPGRAFGVRVGRNARWASLGNGVAAAVMGATGHLLSDRWVFLLTATLAAPALSALRRIGPAALCVPKSAGTGAAKGMTSLLSDRRLVAFAAAIALFQLGSAAVLPLAAGEVTKNVGSGASLVIAACIVLPQAIVVAISLRIGRAAERNGLRRLMILAFAAGPARALLLAGFHNALAIIAIQGLDGVSAAGFGVLMPMLAADITRGTRHFNLCIGLFGLAAGLGAAISTSLAGYVADQNGTMAAFAALALPGAAAVLLIATGLRDRTSAQAVSVKPLSNLPLDTSWDG